MKVEPIYLEDEQRRQKLSTGRRRQDDRGLSPLHAGVPQVGRALARPPLLDGRGRQVERQLVHAADLSKFEMSLFGAYKR